jgi:hypothetical protein
MGADICATVTAATIAEIYSLQNSQSTHSGVTPWL